MHVLDASSALYAWDNYPIKQFPGLWGWIAGEIEVGSIAIPSVALEEVGHKAAECQKWFFDSGINVLQISAAILTDAMRIKVLLGVVGDNYHPKGADENDLLIIASARAHGAILVTNEAVQANIPGDLAKCKIPAVCGMNTVSVPCMNFVQYLKQSAAVYG